MRLPAFPVWLCLLLPATALAAESSPAIISVQLENDLFAASGDRYYTHGFELSILREEEPPAWLDGLAAWLPFYQRGEQLNLVSYTVGHKIFTPDDLQATALIPADRPYAGYLYANMAILSQYGSSGVVSYGNTFDVTVGLVGPSALGEAVHIGSHKLFDSENAQGWDNQLHDELVFGVSYSRIWSLVLPAGETLELGVAPNIGFSLGTAYTYGAGGMMFRLGTHLRRDLAPPNIPPGFPGVGYFRAYAQPSWYFFLGFESRVVARDIFLDGNTYRDSHSVDKEHLVGDMQFGFVYLFDDMRISYSNMLRTKEFDTQQVNTHYGAINISLLLH